MFFFITISYFYYSTTISPTIKIDSNKEKRNINKKEIIKEVVTKPKVALKESITKKNIAVNSIQTSSKTSAFKSKIERKVVNPTKQGKKKTIEERAQFNEGRLLYEYYMQVNPITGKISSIDKKLELKEAENAKLATNDEFARVSAPNYVNRGPGNLGGRTRALVYDKSDATGNTILAGAISGGVFRTTNGGASWVKVSSQMIYIMLLLLHKIQDQVFRIFGIMVLESHLEIALLYQVHYIMEEEFGDQPTVD